MRNAHLGYGAALLIFAGAVALYWPVAVVAVVILVTVEVILKIRRRRRDRSRQGGN